ncbi:ubiquinol oxidase subunit II [Chelatococcus sambhunathii]|uniref:Ubiquinol oxidase polypeptide II n=1 Tax=Chelatococcus sambhunathii TaxID=363953 RepID=A0ABU1DI83_9HYPH|nr:ubiquinol oxidase subunit II [Chelatococcus sambhunathii]MDR4307735.1 ubiquinol oxidase subunit II [Chelatococcus sambhunathii]
MKPFGRLFRALAIIPALFALAGCEMVVMSPSGDIAAQQRDLVVISTVLMLLIIVPVIALTIAFAWKYRSSNKDADYDPDWHHSTGLEVVIWAAPLVIIIALGAITWVSTHLLDPYRPLARLDASRAIPEGVKPLRVQAVALDWKWLFFYPDYGVATVNELAAPVDAPISFQITSSTVMNSFYVPALAGMIYAMPAMETKLHAVINKAGVYDGFSANYSGAGFSDMRFKFHGLAQADFDKWIESVKASGDQLDRAGFIELEKPSVRVAPRKYGSTPADLYDAILNRCVDAAKMCVKDMMRVDAQGGMGLAGLGNVFSLAYDEPRRQGGNVAPKARYVAAICTPEAPRDGRTVEAPIAAPLGKRAASEPLISAGSTRLASSK